MWSQGQGFMHACEQYAHDEHESAIAASTKANYMSSE